jgi:hypothetical protein
MNFDPPENGKGGGKLDGKICRDFPVACVSKRAVKKIVTNASERRSLLAG